MSTDTPGASKTEVKLSTATTLNLLLPLLLMVQQKCSTHVFGLHDSLYNSRCIPIPVLFPHGHGLGLPMTQQSNASSNPTLMHQLHVTTTAEKQTKAWLVAWTPTPLWAYALTDLRLIDNQP